MHQSHRLPRQPVRGQSASAGLYRRGAAPAQSSGAHTRYFSRQGRPTSRGASRLGPSFWQRFSATAGRCWAALTAFSSSARVRQTCVHGGIFAFWLLTFGGAYAGLRALDKPVSAVELMSENQFTTQRLIDELVPSGPDTSFYLYDLRQAQRTLAELPWVRSASVLRGWSGKLKVTVEEHVPAFAWSDVSEQNGAGSVNGESRFSAFVSKDGSLIELPAGEVYGDTPASLSAVENLRSTIGMLPVFEWNGEFSATQAQSNDFLVQYDEITRVLETGELDLSVASLRKSAAGSWSVQLESLQSGVSDASVPVSFELRLGSKDLQSRLQRFVTIYNRGLHRDASTIAYADLRYTSGLAIGWQKQAEQDLTDKKLQGLGKNGKS
ncbi:cell division protein FtsQ/DivIB [Allohahella sp. A8]|uniref:cell division protein FtsQ/DivIB n=1 Tax=Allohahella sp. A8 TaxID=3141461 RepID=UPI003A8084FC